VCEFRTLSIRATYLFKYILCSNISDLEIQCHCAGIGIKRHGRNEKCAEKFNYLKYIMSVKHSYLFVSIMHIATCFDTKESSSCHSVNHNIDISSDSVHFGVPKSVHGKIQVKLLQIIVMFC